MPIDPEPAERPEGLETRPAGAPLPPESHRPDWLVGAGDVLEKGRDEGPEPSRPTIADVPATRAPLRVVPGGKPEPPKGWSAAASSVPKLSIVPSQRPIDPGSDDPRGESPLE